MAGYIGTQPVPQATQTRDAFTATAGQTSFTTSGYTPGFLDVYLNGVKLAAADYTASNGSDVVLTAGAAAGDIFEVVAYTTFELLDPTFGGTVTADSLSVDGGTIKLDGNYPVGSNNVALGDTALDSLTSGTNNTALGSAALRNNTTADKNTAVGYQAGYNTTTPDNNSFFGQWSGYNNTTGAGNTYIGQGAGYSMTTGSENTIIGAYNGNQGGLDIRTSSNNIVLSDGDGNVRAHCDSSGTWTGVGGSTTYGDVGTYGIFNRGSSTATITQGSTYAGSGLYPTGFQSFVYAQGGNANNYAVGVNTSAVGAGTWRAMGRVSTTGVQSYYMPATVFVRIS